MNEQKPENETTQDTARGGDCCSNDLLCQEDKEWHVWYVEHKFIVDYTLEGAKQFFIDDYGVDENSIDWDNTHCDLCDWYESDELDAKPTTFARSVAEYEINNGKVLPFYLGDVTEDLA